MDFFDEAVLKENGKSGAGSGGVNGEGVGLPLIHDEIAVLPDDVSLAARLPYDGPAENGLYRERALEIGGVEAPAGAGEKCIADARESLLRTRIRMR
jgi:hypothetical protein